MKGRVHVLIAAGVAAVAGAEWLHGGAVAWAGLAGAAGLAAGAGVAVWRPGERRPLAALAGIAAAALGAALVAATVEVRRIECCWAAVERARAPGDSTALQRALADATREANRLAGRALAAAELPRSDAFARLHAAVGAGGTGGAPRAGVERGALLLAADGTPWAWAGRHRRLAPGDDTTALRAIMTPFYVTLEARRQAPSGRIAVGSVLLHAEPAASPGARPLAATFAAAHRTRLRFWAPEAAPPEPGLFDWALPEGAVLLSVQPVAPTQGDAKLAAVARWRRVAGVGLAVALLLLLVAAPAGPWRWGAVGLAAWALARAPLGPGPAPPELFSPATFYRPALGEFGASAGSLLALGLVALVAAGALWRRGVRRRWWSVAVAGALVLYAPYLVRYLGRGIEPPAGGVSIALWLTWQAALAVTGMALVLLGAALVRGPAEPSRVPWTLPAACAWAVAAAVAGLWLWRPYGAWPEWYTFLWLPALAGALVPAPRLWALAGVAVVAGTAAALVTWGAAVEGRLELAERDVHQLGRQGDAFAVPALERLGERASALAPPRTGADLYARWHGSALSAAGYPTALALWTPAGEPLATLPLAELDLPPALLSALVRSGAPRPSVERLERVPGVHYVLVAPLGQGAGATVLTVGVGPRSRLVPPNRVARFLRGDPGLEPPYAVSVSLPAAGPAPADPRLAWRRAGWSARGELQLDLPGGARHVHVALALRGPGPLGVRGALIVFADWVLLGVAWLAARAIAEGWRPRVAPLVAAMMRSYRARLTAALIAFFGAPVLAFGVWSFARLRDEARRAGDLLIQQTLRDAVAAGVGTLERPVAPSEAIEELGGRLDADLWLYGDGVLAGTSAPVLGELGLVDPLLAPRIFAALALGDELEVVADDRAAGRAVRVGYRVVRAGAPPRQAVLAAPQLLDDERVRRQQEDLALALILGTLAGLAGAVALAGTAARTLARPVAALRDAALAVGRGAAPPPFPPGAPSELAPVLSAFERMEADVRRSRDALEEARRRTAQVLATVATGVIAVDGALMVTMANPRARELVGAGLEPGVALPAVGPAAWGDVWRAVAEHVAAGDPAVAAREFEIDGRQVRLQLAPLGPAPEGCVIALDDTTDLTRAARVLAWGEMARQVAHEIKNPLTPIRLGVQHLQRARRGQTDFDATLRVTSERILAEIDRLDAIARAFSRFGAPASDAPPLEWVDVHRVAQEVVQLYALGGSSEAPRYDLEGGGGGGGGGGSRARARAAELKEVLVNLLENARAAGARRVVVLVQEGGRRLAVADDGRGVPADALPRVFEPTFSTTSSGSGLGLAIARRLVESWGGSISLESVEGRGTTVTLLLVSE